MTGTAAAATWRCRSSAASAYRRCSSSPPAFAGGRKLYWWEQIAAILHAARGRTAHLAYPRALRVCAADPGAKVLLSDIVKDTPGLDLERFLGELRAGLGVPWDADLEAGLAAPLIMSWDDIRALAAAGMDVESHSRDHRVLETLAPEALLDDLTDSRRELVAQLGRPVRAVAYPVGRLPPPWARRIAAAAGYRLGFTNGSGVNRMWPTALVDPYDIRRLSTERSLSDAMFLTQIALPQLAY